jgi:hypothetical protein
LDRAAKTRRFSPLFRAAASIVCRAHRSRIAGFEVVAVNRRRRRERPEEGKDFFIWIPGNPLKSLDSTKGTQGNPSPFSLVLFGFSLDFLGFIFGKIQISLDGN